MLALKQSSNFLTVNAIGQITIFIVKLAISMAYTVIGYILYMVLSLNIVSDGFVFAFIAASFCVQIYTLVTLTLFQCVCVDVHIANGDKGPWRLVDVINDVKRE